MLELHRLRMINLSEHQIEEDQHRGDQNQGNSTRIPIATEPPNGAKKLPQMTILRN